jgi:hypothetical protein
VIYQAAPPGEILVRLILFSVVPCALIACQTPVGPAVGVEAMRTRVEVAPTTVDASTVAVMTIVSWNTASLPAEFSSCPTPLHEIVDEAGAAIIMSDCLQPRSIRIAGGDTVQTSRALMLRTSSGEGPPAGRYFVRAGWAVDHQLVALSDPFEITVVNAR